MSAYTTLFLTDIHSFNTVLNDREMRFSFLAEPAVRRVTVQPACIPACNCAASMRIIDTKQALVITTTL